MTDAEDAVRLRGEDLEAWASLATLLEWLPAALDAQLLRDSGITHFEYGILYALANAEQHTLRMSVLAGHANSSLSRMSRAASRLERRGWVRRSIDPSDGRYTLAHLTPHGLLAYEQATPGHVHAVERLVLDQLTAAQRRQLKSISDRVLRAISTEDAWRPQ